MIISTTLEKFDGNLWGYHLPISQQQAAPFIGGENRRVNCVVNDKLVLHCALMPYAEGYFILMNQPNIKKLRLNVGDTVKLQIDKDESEYGMPMPDSFMALLAQDAAGSDYFHQLTPGKQRSLIYIVSSVKSIDSQINKGLAILDHLTETHGNLDFKRLNEKIKAYNQRAKLRK